MAQTSLGFSGLLAVRLSLAVRRRLIQAHGGPNEGLQGLFVQRVAFVEVDGAPDLAFETGIEEA